MRQIAVYISAFGEERSLSAHVALFALAACVLISGFGAAAVFYMSFDIVGLDRHEYFPGDPAEADLIVTVGLIVSAFALATLAMTSFFRSKRKDGFTLKLLLVAATSAIVSPLATMPAASRILRRHQGEWRQLAQILRDAERHAQQFADLPGGRLSQVAYDRAKEDLLAHPILFQFNGLKRPVQVIMMQTVPPYVGVDFGDGQNAVFDPVTMFCVYSD